MLMDMCALSEPFFKESGLPSGSLIPSIPALDRKLGCQSPQVMAAAAGSFHWPRLAVGTHVTVVS